MRRFELGRQTLIYVNLANVQNVLYSFILQAPSHYFLSHEMVTLIDYILNLKPNISIVLSTVLK